MRNDSQLDAGDSGGAEADADRRPDLERALPAPTEEHRAPPSAERVSVRALLHGEHDGAGPFEAPSQPGDAELRPAPRDVGEALRKSERARTELGLRLDRANAELLDAAVEQQRLEEALERAREERGRLLGEVDGLHRSVRDLRALLHALGGDVSVSGPSEAASPATFDLDRRENATQAVADRRPAESSSSTALAVFDPTGSGEVIFKHLEAAGTRVRVLDGVSDEPAAGTPLATAFNFAAPSAWRRAAELQRERRSGAPVLGYVLPGGALAGFWLGPVEVAVLSGEKTLIATLRRLLPGVRRVISLSAPDVMWCVWTAMKADRISTAVVFDGAQAVDLLPSVRPEAAVLHVSPKTTDVFRAIAGIRATESYRDIPLLLLLDPDPGPGDEAYLKSGSTWLTRKGDVSAAKICAALLESLGRRPE